jgi:hypothetical protein
MREILYFHEICPGGGSEPFGDCAGIPGLGVVDDTDWHMSKYRAGEDKGRTCGIPAGAANGKKMF